MEYVKGSIYTSLAAQLITTIISLDGFRYKLEDKDKILKDILLLETVVQVIEACFYVWAVFALSNLKTLVSRRYIDWVITTPTMLLSTIIFMGYNTSTHRVRFWDFIIEHRSSINKILIYNWLMLLFGYLGEISIIDKKLSVLLGFIFFYMLFDEINKNYTKDNPTNKKVLIFMVSVWALYGVAALGDDVTSNTAYNVLDVVSKNLYGLFIYYYIRQIGTVPQ